MITTQKTTNSSEKDINQKFNLVEFNKKFEQNDLVLEKTDKIDTPTQICKDNQLNTFNIIIYIILMIGILLLLFNLFIL